VSAHGAVGRDQHARYQRDLADVQRRVRKHQAAKCGTSVRAGTGGDPALVGSGPAAISSPHWIGPAGPSSLSDRVERMIFAAFILAGLSIWLAWAPGVLLRALVILVGIGVGLLVVKALWLSERF